LEARGFKPSKFQRDAIERITNEPTGAALVASETGTGKTLVAVECLRSDEVSLIVCPLSVINSWRESIIAQHPELDGHVHTIKNTDKKNKVFHMLEKGVPGAYLIGSEFFHIAVTRIPEKEGGIIRGKALNPKSRVVFNDRNGKRIGSTWAGPDGVFELKQTKVQCLNDAIPECMVDMNSLTWEPYTTKGRERRWLWSKVHTVDVIVVDEVHSAKNRNSRMYNALQSLKPNRLKIGMSATPGGDTFDGLWAVCRWLWPKTTDDKGELIVDRSKYRWQVRWMDYEWDPYTTTHKRFVKEKKEGEFVATLPCYIREEADRLPVKPWYVAHLEMTPKQKQQYEAMLENSIAWLQENPLVADLPVVQKIRLRQMCLGEVSLDENTGEVSFKDDCESTFIEAAIKITHREEGKKILFFTNSNSFAHVLVKRLNKHYGHEVARPWTGSESQDYRTETKKMFMAADGKLSYIVGTISKAIAVGTDGLQHVCNTEVWMGKALESILNEQGEGRLNRRGQTADAITRYELLVEGSAQEEDFARDARKFMQRSKELSSRHNVKL